MRQRRIAILLSLLTAGVLGVYWVATGQEGRTPWPPPPVKFDATTSGTEAVPPPVPISGTMPSVPIDKQDHPVRKWLTPGRPGSAADTLKLRACGVGEMPNGIQQVGFQEQGRASEIPPPVPAKPTIAAMPSARDTDSRPAPIMPAVPGGSGPALPVLPPPPIGSALRGKTAPAMPIADPPTVPTRSAQHRSRAAHACGQKRQPTAGVRAGHFAQTEGRATQSGAPRG